MKTIIITEDALKASDCKNEHILYFNELKHKKYELFDLTEKCMQFENFDFATFLVKKFSHELAKEQIVDLFNICKKYTKHDNLEAVCFLGDNFFNKLTENQQESLFTNCSHCNILGESQFFAEKHIDKIVNTFIKKNYEFSDDIMYKIRWYLTIGHKVKIINHHNKNNYSYWNISNMVTDGMSEEYKKEMVRSYIKNNQDITGFDRIHEFCHTLAEMRMSGELDEV